jgi:CheY-like chemotaxis protein
MDGIEMIKRIRESNSIKTTPILVISAYGQRRITDAMQAGANGYIEKPIDLDTFLEEVRSRLAAD